MSVFISPQCPRCSVELTQDWIRNGPITCPYCGRPFEAAVFQTTQRPQRAVEIVSAFVEGANACANHARNAAVTSCQRCGLLICALCDLDLGEGSLCPSCFERMRAEGSLRGAATRYQDYASIATLSAIVGFVLSFMLLGIPAGALTMYYARRGMVQRRQEGSSTVAMVIVMIIGLLELLAGFGIIAFFIWSLFNAVKP